MQGLQPRPSFQARNREPAELNNIKKDIDILDPLKLFWADYKPYFGIE
jgi:hypothetical protein